MSILAKVGTHERRITPSAGGVKFPSLEKLVGFLESRKKDIPELDINGYSNGYEGNGINADTASDIVNALKGSQTLTALAIWGHKMGMGNDGAIAVADILDQYPALISLNLNDNNISDNGATEVANALRKCRTIIWLQLACNRIDTGGASVIANILKENHPLISLNLKENPLGDKGTIAIAEGLEQNQSLAILNLCDTHIYDAGAVALAKMLERNHTLTTLDLARNKIGKIGITAIIKALVVNHTITKIAFGSESINAEDRAAIKVALERNKQIALKKLQFESLTEKAKTDDFVKKVLEIAPHLIKYIENGVLSILEVYDMFKVKGFALNLKDIEDGIYNIIIKTFERDPQVLQPSENQINDAIDKLIKFGCINSRYAGTITSSFIESGMFEFALAIINAHNQEIILDAECIRVFFLNPYPKQFDGKNYPSDSPEIMNYQELLDFMLEKVDSSKKIIDMLVSSIAAFNVYTTGSLLQIMKNNPLFYTQEEKKQVEDSLIHKAEIISNNAPKDTFSKEFIGWALMMLGSIPNVEAASAINVDATGCMYDPESFKSV